MVSAHVLSITAQASTGDETTSNVTDNLSKKRHYVTSERLNRRTCPSTDCGIVGQLFFREGVSIFEMRGEWARITKRYHASCVDGRSEHVDTGNASCDPSNGISDGKFSEWVSTDFLSEDRPLDPAESASDAERLIAGSDDFARHRNAFAIAANSLISQRRCKEKDFLEVGGWRKSSSHKSEPIYFTYCDGFSRENRIYLNAVTGEIF